MSVHPKIAPDLEELDFEFELVNVADIPAEEWDDDLRQAVAEAEEDERSGRPGVPHALVMEWLSRVGTPDETPMPAEWLRR